MSTHYGRMVVLDDRVVLFANPEDAAEYIGFDLQPVSRRTACTRRTARSTSSSTATCTSGTPARRTGSRARRSTPRGGSSASTPIRASAPPETHWTLEHFQKYSVEDFEKDVFDEGHVDVAVFQSTYLKEWYTNGLQRRSSRTRSILDRFPGKLILNGRWDPREGEAGLRQLEADHAKYGIQGVKLYTAEWHKGSRGWKLTDPEAVPFLDKCVELGIKNIHVHKGPTIWPLDKDAFDVSDVDHVATDYQDLNFIIEHVGLPRIEDFCFMATQERNVYAGLAVVIGGLMHARPKFFAKVMGELLFWVGEDKMLFGSDYAIWEPKWQVEGFVDWEMPDDSEYADYPRLGTEGKKKILGLNGAKLYGVEVPEELPAAGRRPRSRPRRRTRSWSKGPREPALPSPRGARHGLRPGARRADHHARLRRLLRRDRRRRRRRCACGCRRRSARRTSRS